MTPEYPIFKANGITADLNLLMMRTQELAMAVNLQGIHHAACDYTPTSCSHGGHELAVMTKKAGSGWKGCKHLSVNLPSSASTDQERLESRRQLGEAVEALSNLLKEGQQA